MPVLVGLLVIVLIGVAAWWAYGALYQAKLSNAGATATVSGVVTEGPTAPVCQLGSPCTRPVAGHGVEALDAAGNVVASATTDEAGKYTLHVQPGQYVLRLSPPVGISSGNTEELNAKPGQNTLDITVDSGLR